MSTIAKDGTKKVLDTNDTLRAVREGAEIKRGFIDGRCWVDAESWDRATVPVNVFEKLREQGLLVKEGMGSFGSDVYVWRDSRRGQVALEKARKARAESDRRVQKHEAEVAERAAKAAAIKQRLADAGIDAEVSVLEDGRSQIVMTANMTGLLLDLING